MATHSAHPDPDGRDEFLVDGCPRCKEYVEDMGVHFTPDRFRAFWRKMVEVEYETKGAYLSSLDKQLGKRLYLVSLQLERSLGLDPRGLAGEESVRRRELDTQERVERLRRAGGLRP